MITQRAWREGERQTDLLANLVLVVDSMSFEFNRVKRDLTYLMTNILVSKQKAQGTASTVQGVMKIHVELVPLSGEHFTLRVRADSPITRLKTKIHAHTGIKAHRQRLFLDGHILEDTVMLDTLPVIQYPGGNRDGPDLILTVVFVKQGCSHCGAEATKHCSDCRQAYCSRACQTAHWPVHMHECPGRTTV